MAIFRHFDKARSSNFVLTIKAVFIIFKIRFKKRVLPSKDTKKTWHSQTTNSEDRPTSEYLYHPRFS